MNDIDKVVDVLRDILFELQEMNSKLDDIKGSGLYNSISDVCDKLDEVKEDLSGIDSSISDLG